MTAPSGGAGVRAGGDPGATAAPGPDAAAGSAGHPVALLAGRAARHPDEVALRTKRRGLWEETTWAEYRRRASRTGGGLLACGLSRGDRVAIVADNGVEWLAADLGALGAGLVTVIADPLGPLDDERELLRASGAVAAVVQDEEQLDRLEAIRGSLPDLRVIAVIDARGIRHLGDGVIGIEELESRASDDEGEPGPGAFGWAPHDPATIVPSLGTTGAPKAAVLSHAGLAAVGRGAAEALALGPGDDVLSALPLCFMTERAVSELAPLHGGAVVNFGEGPATLLDEMREVQPTVLLGVPHLWGRIEGDVRARSEGAGVLKRSVMGYLRRRGPALAAVRAQGRRGAGSAGVAWTVGGRALGRLTGTGRLRVALSTGAWLPSSLHESLRALGVPLRQAYGQVETGGLATVAEPGDARPDSVGVAVPGVGLRVAADGGIQVSGATLFSGYLGDDGPGTTGDGWWVTGDLGVESEAGGLTVTGRVRDLITTSAGVSVHPARTEKMIEESPLVREAVVVGDDRPHLAALIALDEPGLSAWAARRMHPVTGLRELIDDPEVRRAVQEWIDDVNGRLASPERIRAFALLPGGSAGDYGGLTSIHEVRRRAVLARFSDLVEGLYRS